MCQANTSYETSFVQLFDPQIIGIQRIEIPLIQRDYAQGRQGEMVERIRTKFLDALCAAVKPNNAGISLDFVYGDVGSNDVFYPLDGQQRLTTLFLFHWYLAWRANAPIKNEPWTKFTYATRPGARLFCERLAEYQPQNGEIGGGDKLSDWLIDQAWYFFTWQNDPSIQSMLVMLDDLHKRFSSHSETECKDAWYRLIDPQQPAISFHLLPMKANGLTDDLYIKMNSRGKPLTAFENFKANFEDMLNNQHPNTADGFAKKVDTDWTDILWKYRGADNLIDDKFMRYFRFVTEVCAWLSNVSFNDKKSTEDLAEEVYGKNNSDANKHLDFLLKAFDTWHGIDIKAEFESIFTAIEGGESNKILLFNAFDSSVDLFAACCHFFGEKKWTLSHTLLLYAVLINRIYNTNGFPRRLRILRNLTEATLILNDKMHNHLADVERIVVHDNLQGVDVFNKAQVDNEFEKENLLQQQPSLKDTLYQLEDHILLRGCLTSFDLNPSIDPNIFMQRAGAFFNLFNNCNFWPELTGALLAINDYSRKRNRWTGYRFADFGSSTLESQWHELFKFNRDHPQFISALMDLLDQVAKASSIVDCLKNIQDIYLDQCSRDKKMDWRYYFVRYPAMREGKSGRYAISSSGYSVCMLDKWQMNSNYRDPYLLAILRESKVINDVKDPWFYGYETEPRLMVLNKSGINIQCADTGWQISESITDPIQKAALDKVCSQYGINHNHLYAVPQNNDGIDAIDRIDMGSRLLKDLVKAGL